jgi:hypothetical protein
MHPGEIYTKTEAGVRELRERKLNLPIALRSLLIMIDGSRSVADVLERARALRVDAEAIAELERVGLVARKFGAPSTTKSAAAPEERSGDEVERFIAIQRKLSDVVNAHLGFRGYLLMMRLQRAENLRDLHDFLPDFARALVKRMGIDAAAPIVAEFERLIVARSG